MVALGSGDDELCGAEPASQRGRVLMRSSEGGMASRADRAAAPDPTGPTLIGQLCCGRIDSGAGRCGTDFVPGPRGCGHGLSPWST